MQIRHLVVLSPFSYSSMRELRVFVLPRSARLKFINEPMYPQIVPTLRPRPTHRLRIGEVVDLYAHALLNQPREDFGMRRAAGEPSGELDERCKPALEYRLDLWKRQARYGRQSHLGASAVRMADDDDYRWTGERRGGWEKRTVLDTRDKPDCVCEHGECSALSLSGWIWP